MHRRTRLAAMAVAAVTSAATLAVGAGTPIIAESGSGTWSEISHVLQSRQDASLVALPGGRAVLLGGATRRGTADSEAAGVIELWQDQDGTFPILGRDDPRFGWSAAGFQPMDVSPIAVAIGPDLVLVTATVSGRDGLDTWLVDMDPEVPPTDRVTAVDPATLMRGRGVQSADRVPALVATGRRAAVLVGTEHGVQRFDATGPRAGTWTHTQPMGHARQDMAVAALPDGRVLAAGGRLPEMDEAPHFIPTGDDATDTVATFRTSEMRDPETGAWTGVATMPFPLRDAAAVTLTDGRVLLAGGLTERSSDNELLPADPLLYDPAADTWTVLSPPPVVALETRLVALPDGSALLIGGLDADHRAVGAYRWDPATGAWSEAGSMNVPRSDHGAVVLDDGRVVVAGGRDRDRDQTSVAEIWTPTGWVRPGSSPSPG